MTSQRWSSISVNRADQLEQRPQDRHSKMVISEEATAARHVIQRVNGAISQGYL